MLELQDQLLQWKRQALNVVVVDVRLAIYNTFFREHTLLKLEIMAWWQKTRKKEVMWNEFKHEPNAILDVTPFFTLVDKATYHR